jgi:hypothetical protein
VGRARAAQQKGPLRRVVSEGFNEHGSQIEHLECGHVVHRRQDAFGHTNASRRRCRHCRATLASKDTSVKTKTICPRHAPQFRIGEYATMPSGRPGVSIRIGDGDADMLSLAEARAIAGALLAFANNAGEEESSHGDH